MTTMCLQCNNIINNHNYYFKLARSAISDNETNKLSTISHVKHDLPTFNGLKHVLWVHASSSIYLSYLSQVMVMLYDLPYKNTWTTRSTYVPMLRGAG